MGLPPGITKIHNIIVHNIIVVNCEYVYKKFHDMEVNIPTGILLISDNSSGNKTNIAVDIQIGYYKLHSSHNSNQLEILINFMSYIPWF